MAMAQSNIAQDVTYTFYFDTMARNQDCRDSNAAPNNPTNPAVLPVQLSRDEAPFSQLYLASLELPKLAQYTIEDDWSNLYFSEGIQLQVTDPADNCVREFSVMEDGAVRTGILPAFLNPISSVSAPGTTTPILTFAFEHGLEILHFCPQADPIRLISTNVVGAPALATNFVVLDAFSVQLALPAPVAWVPPYGSLYAPSIISPANLACMVTAALNIVAPGEYRVTYDESTGLFSFCVTRPNLGTKCFTQPPPICAPRYGLQPPCQPSPTTNQSNVSILIGGPRCLPYLMGFGRCNTSLAIPSSPPYCVVAQNGFCPCESRLTIPPGNYDALGLGTAISQQLNRFYFAGGCARDPLARKLFTWADACGVCHTIPIDYGLYNPNTFAAFLQAGMQAVDPAFAVTYSSTLGFCFENTAGTHFSLEFQEPGTQDVAQRLGYTFNSFRGEAQYCSNQPVNVPLKNCCTEPKFLQNVYEISINSGTQQFLFQPTLNSCSTVTAIVAGGIPQSAIIDTTPYAHGFQVGDVVEVGGFEFHVIAVPDAFHFEIDLGSVPIGSLPVPGTCFCPAEKPLLNLYFAPSPCQINPIKPNILGFYAQDVLGGGMLKSPSIYNVDPPAYLLLQMVVPDGVITRNAHTNDEKETLRFILAKINLYPNFKNERIFPFNGFIQQLAKMNRMKLQLLNPDHTLYRLHGSNWSGTLCFLVPEGQSKLGCF